MKIQKYIYYHKTSAIKMFFFFGHRTFYTHKVYEKPIPAHIVYEPGLIKAIDFNFLIIQFFQINIIGDVKILEDCIEDRLGSTDITFFEVVAIELAEFVPVGCGKTST